ncbi:hypothetical protein GIB67_028918 [Kingdonia uniflora]|uniref:Uncharacterized protein n=1 Tax=Kingdonia uniflora TaxID=39325 RepID=A0A7J7LSZ3_9MAGN|nr:hypothetical protein GIB67_028918 [Kingdonia uniflora]
MFSAISAIEWVQSEICGLPPTMTDRGAKNDSTSLISILRRAQHGTLGSYPHDQSASTIGVVKVLDRQIEIDDLRNNLVIDSKVLVDVLRKMNKKLPANFFVKLGFELTEIELILSYVRGTIFKLDWELAIKLHPRFFCEGHNVEAWIEVLQERKRNPVLKFRLIYNANKMADCWNLKVWDTLPTLPKDHPSKESLKTEREEKRDVLPHEEICQQGLK